MSLFIIVLVTFVLLPLSVYLFSKVEQERGRSTISMEDLKDLSLNAPPVIVSQMKNGEVQQTLCYFSPYDDAEPQTSVVEVDVRDRFLSKLQLDNTITISA